MPVAMPVPLPVAVVLRVSGEAASLEVLPTIRTAGSRNLARKKREWTQWSLRLCYYLVLAVQGAGPGARQEGPGASARRHWCHWQSGDRGCEGRRYQYQWQTGSVLLRGSSTWSLPVPDATASVCLWWKARRGVVMIRLTGRSFITVISILVRVHWQGGSSPRTTAGRGGANTGRDLLRRRAGGRVEADTGWDYPR